MNREIETGQIPVEEVSREGFVPPKITRDAGGNIRWKLLGNTPEENKLMGIKNVQGLFLEAHPELLERVSFGEDGMIVKDKKDNAKEFILEHAGSLEKLTLITGESVLSKRLAPFFDGNYRTVLSKSFSSLGIDFEWEDPAPEGWMTNGALSKQTNKHFSKVKKLVNRFRESHPEWFREHLDSSGKPTEHYAPELISLICRELRQQIPPPEEWMTNEALVKRLSRGFRTIKRVANQYRTDHSEWFGEYLNAAGRLSEYYSPELIDQIIKTFGEREKHKHTISPDQANEELMRFLEVKDE